MNIAEIEAGGIQFRAATIEDVDDRTRELLVRAVPYGETFHDIGGSVDERFLPHAFAAAAKAPHRLTLMNSHGGDLIGRGVAMDDPPTGPEIRYKVGSHDAAQQAMIMVSEGTLTDVSIEFRAMPKHFDVERAGDRLRVTHRRAHLTGSALVPEGAYGEAAHILSLRDAEQERAREQARLWLEQWKRADPFTR